MAGIRSALVFILQSVVVGLAVAFLVVLARPDLMPAAGNALSLIHISEPTRH